MANHTSYVRVKTDHESVPSVVLPVEVEVSDQSGLFLSRELLDFGVVKGGGMFGSVLVRLASGSEVANLMMGTCVGGSTIQHSQEFCLE